MIKYKLVKGQEILAVSYSNPLDADEEPTDNKGILDRQISKDVMFYKAHHKKCKLRVYVNNSLLKEIVL